MTTGHDEWIRTALAPARALEPSDAEVAHALARVASARRSRRRGGAPRASRTLVFAMLATLLAATAAAAATGLIPVGSVFRGEGFHADERQVEETVVATGSVPKAGAWRLTTFETKTKHPVQCLKLELTSARGRRAPGPRSSGYCGHIGAFWEFGHGRKAAAVERGELLLFGTAPAQARSVELIGNGGVRLSAEVHPAPAGGRGGYWAIAAPPGLDKAQLTWRDADGLPGGSLDVSYRFDGPSAPTVVGTGRTPIAGPWRMAIYESERHVVDGDLYEPEGLPCIELSLLDPPDGFPQRGGGCGVQPKTPGFTRGQARYPRAVGGGVRELVMYGRAPDRAARVEVDAGGRKLSTRAFEGPAGVPGRFWLIARPPRDFAGGHVYWVDRDGERGSRRVEVLPL
jgi:hypothetical protein